MFDHVHITVRSGKGGDGAIAFRHEKSIAKGGPYGGNGGHGGSVYLVASKDIETLSQFQLRQHFFATDGENGKSKLCNGRDGKDVIVHVPVGTIVRGEKGEFLADLNFDGDKICIAHGGRGGRGNAAFKSATRRTPNVAENGHPCEEKILYLELRLMADAGLIGFPNAGKSSLLVHMTRAKSIVAEYKFSTIEPVLGVYNRNDCIPRFVLADIPGLIEGASQGKGMGFEFLRHIMRTRVLIHCIDPTDPEHPDLEKAYSQINQELLDYSEQLALKKQIVVFTKMDMVENAKPIDDFENAHKDLIVAKVSVLSDESLLNLAKIISGVVIQEKQKEKSRPFASTESEKVYRLAQSDIASIPTFEIVPLGESRYEILGPRVVLTKRLINLSTDEGLDKLLLYLDKIGVNKKLDEMNIPSGTTIVLDGFEFEYLP